MEIINNASALAGVLTASAFLVNIIVQLTKSFVPLPTKLWCILVAITVNLGVLAFCSVLGIADVNAAGVIFSVFAGFIVAYVAMYGFDTLKELWQRFKKGENINDDN